MRGYLTSYITYLKEELTLACSDRGGATLEHGPAAGLDHYHACGVEVTVGCHQDGPHVTGALGKLQPS
jgi:hypothetical protein